MTLLLLRSSLIILILLFTSTSVFAQTKAPITSLTPQQQLYCLSDDQIKKMADELKECKVFLEAEKSLYQQDNDLLKQEVDLLKQKNELQKEAIKLGEETIKQYQDLIKFQKESYTELIKTNKPSIATEIFKFLGTLAIGALIGLAL